MDVVSRKKRNPEKCKGSEAKAHSVYTILQSADDNDDGGCRSKKQKLIWKGKKVQKVLWKLMLPKGLKTKITV